MSVSVVGSAGSDLSAGNAIRVAVVDDSAVIRGLVSRWIREDPDLEIVGRYSNGKLAVEQAQQGQPDVVILDIEMPVMDGLAALPELLRLLPDAKIIMSSALTQRNAEVSMKALSMGAADYIPKPRGDRGTASAQGYRTDLIEMIKAIAGRPRLTGSQACRAALSSPEAGPVSAVGIRPNAISGAEIVLRRFSQVRPRILAIGCSTGGPRALIRVLSDIDQVARQVPIVITQHMPPTFTAILARHLTRTTLLECREARDGEVIAAGTIYVAPGGRHMALEAIEAAARIRIYDGPDVNFCKPAVDPLFESVALAYGSGALALILTGMGHDGANGALKIARSGGSVIAQDQATSVVWGMPGAAAVAGACAAILPLEKIGRKVDSIFQGALA